MLSSASAGLLQGHPLPIEMLERVVQRERFRVERIADTAPDAVVVGRHVCREVMRTLGPDALVVGDHKPERGREFAAALGPMVRSVAVDVHRRETIEQALDEAAPGLLARHVIEQASAAGMQWATRRRNPAGTNSL